MAADSVVPLGEFNTFHCVMKFFCDLGCRLSATYVAEQLAKIRKNRAIRNCWISSRVEIKLHPFITSAKLSEAQVPKGYNFIAPQAPIQKMYY